MTDWKIVFLPEADDDFGDLAGNQKKVVSKILARVSKNPLPSNEGGYGKPLRNNNDTKLAGLLKIKLKKEGIRIVYKVIRTETEMLIVVIGARADDEVYEIADARVKKYNL